MTYATVQSAVASLVKNVTGYSARNVTEGDYKIFAKGLRKAVVLGRGASTSERASVNSGTMTILNRWVVNVEIWVPYKNSPKDTRDLLNTEMTAVTGELNKWPYLNGTSGVLHHDTGTANDPEEFTVAGSGGRWWLQRVPLIVLEQETVTASE